MDGLSWRRDIRVVVLGKGEECLFSPLIGRRDETTMLFKERLCGVRTETQTEKV